MGRNRTLHLALVLFVPLLLAACAGASSQTVTFQIPISPGSFSPQAIIRVTVWNTDQLRLSQQTSDCAISHDVQTGLDQVECPPGVTYQEIHPEEFTFAADNAGRTSPAAPAGTGLTAPTTSVHVGEDYAVLISGLSQDNCNNASARVEGRARASVVTLENLAWATTAMACP